MKTKTKALSYSAYNRYVTCPKQYDLHYNKRLRPIGTPAHLIFGSAIDKGLNAILLGQNSALAELTNGLLGLLEPGVEFNFKDYDGELIDADERESLLKECQDYGYDGEDIDGLASELLANQPNNSPKQRKALAALCQSSLLAKGYLMLEAYVSKVMPLIDEVVAVQKESGGGTLDFIAIMKGYNAKAIVDNKTASRPYPNDAVKRSVQLANYANDEGIKLGVYVVLDKQIKKNRIKTCRSCGHVAAGSHKTCDIILLGGERCHGEWTQTIRPEANVQILIDELPQELLDMTKEAKADVTKAIKAKCFPRNLNACANQYGKPCVYSRYCWEGKEDGLKIEPEGDK